MQAQASFVANKRFFDDRNFPYGFRRSGDFTLKQAELLELCGHHMMALEQGTIEPSNDEEVHFVSVCRGECPAETAEEKTWVTYREALIRKGRVLNLFTSYQPDEDDDYEDDVDE